MVASEEEFFKNLVPPESEMKRIGPIFDRQTYLAMGRLSKDQLIKHAGLKPQHSVMDVGCGFGRVAIHLLNVLAPQSNYLGFDVVPSEIEWCRANITPRNPRFAFEHLDVRNKTYNPTGTLLAKNIRFPVQDGARFDLVFLFSVFTHMLPEFIATYLAEIHRHLVPGGRLFASFFLINEDSRRLMDAGLGQFRFVQERGGYYAQSRNDPEAAIAFDEDAVWRMMMTAGFIRDKVVYGRWPGRSSPDNGQDFLVCSKPK